MGSPPAAGDRASGDASAAARTLEAGPMPASLARPGWRFWLAISTLWAFFGFVVGNHVYFSMRGHGHDWGLILLWQIGGAAAWILLTPAVLALDRRHPLGPDRRWRVAPLHLVAALMFAGLRLIPLTALSLVLDPFRPVAREATFAGEYGKLLAEWLLVDLMVYAAILVLARVLGYREQAYQDQLRASRLRAELAAAELRALELEVQPHFLFNALNAIATLIRAGQGRRAADMVVALADLLRSTLQRRGRVFLTLAEELEHVQRYLDLQKARFQDRLEVRVEMAAEARRARVPGLVLQPLVENAFRHGIERKRGPGSVAITARRSGAWLDLSVRDDGPGPDADPTSSGTGIGLANLRARLEALFEDRWRLELGAAEGGGTRVAVSIPWSEGTP